MKKETKKSVISAAACLWASALLSSCMVDVPGRGVTVEVDLDDYLSDTADTSTKEFDFVRGKRNGNGYFSETFSVGVELDESYTFFSDEKMAEMNDIPDMSEENIRARMELHGGIYEMEADNGDNGSVLFISTDMEKLGMQSYDERQYAEYIFEELNGQYKAVTETEGEISDIKAAEKDACCIKFSIGGGKNHQYHVFFKSGKYMYTVTITVPEKEEAEKILSGFYGQA